MADLSISTEQLAAIAELLLHLEERVEIDAPKD